jgi:hypothetical protein
MSSATLRARFLPALPSTSVRYDTEQTLSAAQQTQARNNIGAITADDISIPDISPLPLVQASSITVGAATGLVAPDYYEISSGIDLELALEAILEIT